MSLDVSVFSFILTSHLLRGESFSTYYEVLPNFAIPIKRRLGELGFFPRIFDMMTVLEWTS